MTNFKVLKIALYALNCCILLIWRAREQGKARQATIYDKPRSDFFLKIKQTYTLLPCLAAGELLTPTDFHDFKLNTKIINLMKYAQDSSDDED